MTSYILWSLFFHSHTTLRVCTTFKYSLRYLKCNLWCLWETRIACLRSWLPRYGLWPLLCGCHTILALENFCEISHENYALFSLVFKFPYRLGSSVEEIVLRFRTLSGMLLEFNPFAYLPFWLSSFSFAFEIFTNSKTEKCFF